MNEKGAGVLVKAAMDGRHQARGAYAKADGSRCAVGFLAEAAGLVASEVMLGATHEDSLRGHAALSREYDLRPMAKCPECGTTYSEHNLIVHINDDHKWDLLAIARKLGPDAV